MKNNQSYFLIIILFFTSCGFFLKKNLQNNAYLYQEKITKIKAKYQIFHQSSTTSTLFCKIKSNDLLSVFSANKKQNKIHYSISGKLFIAENESILIDSFFVQKSIVDTSKWIVDQFTFSANMDEYYLLNINLTDLNKSSSITKNIYFEKENNSKENFQIYKENEMQYNNSFNLGDSLYIRHNSRRGNLFVRFFNEEFPIAEDPFVLGEIKANKIFPKESFTLKTDSDFFLLPIQHKGIYQIVEEATVEKGLNILAFENDFPAITYTKDMIPPLQYINTKEEMQELILAKDKKIATDQYWLRKAKNDKQKGKQLIRTFYKRVENANRFFTSYKAGWKTDRGMILIIFGAPNIIHQSKKGESWIYGEKNNMYALNFTFTKIKNKFSDNDFQLNRSTYFKNIWNTAKNAWRAGYPYSDMDVKEKIYEQERRQRQSQSYFWY